MLGMNKWETLNPSFSCTSLIHSCIQQICIDDTLLQALEEAVSKLDLTPSSTELQSPWKCPPFKDEKRKAQKSTEVMPGHTVYPQSSASPVSLLPAPNSDHRKKRTGSYTHGCKIQVEPYENVFICQNQSNVHVNIFLFNPYSDPIRLGLFPHFIGNWNRKIRKRGCSRLRFYQRSRWTNMPLLRPLVPLGGPSRPSLIHRLGSIMVARRLDQKTLRQHKHPTHARHSLPVLGNSGVPQVCRLQASWNIHCLD